MSEIGQNDKKTLGIVFGGQSNEHEISCLSAINVISSVDTARWNVILIGITKDGRWVRVDSVQDIKDATWEKSQAMACILPDAKVHGVLLGSCSNEENNHQRGDINEYSFLHLDVIFPVLHGRLGEDGTIQGLFEMSGIPYVGCGVFASAASMDKFYTKLIVETLGIRQADYVGVKRCELSDEYSRENVIRKIEQKIPYPLFIKPSRSGSSVGVTRASNRSELLIGLETAAQVDSKILVEEYIDGRELECSVFGDPGGGVFASGVGEIVSAGGFYDYDAKYNDPDSQTLVDPILSSDVEGKIRKYSIDIFNALDGFGMARVDFRLDEKKNEVVFNEINTIPGFTAISMYPMLWEKKGISRQKLIEDLIEGAFYRQ